LQHADESTALRIHRNCERSRFASPPSFSLTPDADQTLYCKSDIGIEEHARYAVVSEPAAPPIRLHPFVHETLSSTLLHLCFRIETFRLNALPTYCLFERPGSSPILVVSGHWRTHRVLAESTPPSSHVRSFRPGHEPGSRSFRCSCCGSSASSRFVTDRRFA